LPRYIAFVSGSGDLTLSKPIIVFRSVVLPAPLGPKKTVDLPYGIVIEIFLRIVLFWIV
jgi:hypothetical protein